MGCVMSPWFLTIFIDVAVTDMNSKLVRRRLVLLPKNDRDWKLITILHADLINLLTDNERTFQISVNECDWVREMRKLSENV